MTTGNTIAKFNEDYKCLIHLDRLSITFKLYSGSTFLDYRNPDYIPQIQKYNDITIVHDTSLGLGAYYHSYRVYYRGLFVGKLHSATKLKKNELQFDFSKEVFYAFHNVFWHEVYEALTRNLGILYNNIRYLEIAVDTCKNLLEQFSSLYQNTVCNNLRISDRYRLKANTIVNVMNNGFSYVIKGAKNEIAIYNKSKYAEVFIKNFFENNGLINCEVYRIESRLKWDYIRYLRNKKQLDITIETLLDQGKLANIFKISTKNKLSFKDTSSSWIDSNRNKKYQSMSIIDDLNIFTSEIETFNHVIQNSHYKNTSVDENIMRQNYYMFLETGNKKYFLNFKSSSSVANYSTNQIIEFLTKYNNRYKGNRTDEVNSRMNYAFGKVNLNLPNKLNRLFRSVVDEIKFAIQSFI